MTTADADDPQDPDTQRDGDDDAPPLATAQASGISRRTKIALIGGAAVLVAGIAAAVGIPALGKHGTPQSSPTSSPPRTSTERVYGAQIVLPFTGLQAPRGVAVDGTGNVYVVDFNNTPDRRFDFGPGVVKLAAGSSTQEVLPFTGLGQGAYDVAVDRNGAVYVTDKAINQVVKLATGSSAPEVLLSLTAPEGVAVDSTGTVYVADSENGRVLKKAAGSATQEVLPFTGLAHPTGVAVDSTGTVYVADGVHDRVLKLAAGSTTQEVLPFAGLKFPSSVAVDSNGNVYVADYGNNRVVKLAAGSATQEVLPFTGLTNPSGVAVGKTGTVYISDKGRVLELPVR
jgi:serine/threonine protein kinase, bacterial